MTRRHPPFESEAMHFVAEHARHFRVDATCLEGLLGFKPDRDFRLPLQPVRNVVENYVASVSHWMSGALSLDGDPEQPARAELITRYAGLREALAGLYVHLATYAARRCPIPVSPKKLGAYQDFQEITRTIHSFIPNAPPLAIEFVFVGKDEDQSKQSGAPNLRRFGSENSQSRKRKTYAVFVAAFLGGDAPTDLDSDRHYESATTVDPGIIPSLLGFAPPRDLRLPLDPVRDLIEAYDEAAAFWDCRMSTARTLPQLMQYPALAKACANVYWIMATYRAQRICIPVGPSLVGLRAELSDLIHRIHTAIPGAPELDVEVVFVGRHVPHLEPSWIKNVRVPSAKD